MSKFNMVFLCFISKFDMSKFDMLFLCFISKFYMLKLDMVFLCFFLSNVFIALYNILNL